LVAAGLWGARLGAQEIETCPADQDESQSGLVGLVRQASAGYALPGAEVTAAWVTSDGQRTSASADTDETGVYRLCGLPTNEEILLTATFVGYSTDPISVRIEPGPPAGYDFGLDMSGQSAMSEADLEPGRVVGRVLDRETGRTVEAADVVLQGVNEQRATNANGRFVFDDIAPGPYSVSVRHLAFEGITQAVYVPPNRTIEVNFELTADPIDLEPLVITAVRDKRLENNGFYERQEMSEKLGLGVFFTRDEIRRTAAHQVTQLLQRVPGVRVICSGSRACTVRMTRGQPSLSRRSEQGCDNANVYIDGVRVIRETSPSDVTLDDFVLASEITAMEVYRGAAEIPADFGGAVGRCGAIVIWTGTGGGD
jgi:hypothetical protein